MKNKLNYFLLISFILIVVSCGMSDKEKNEIAIITCNIIAESRNMDASLRIKEVNAAREKIGEEKFLETDEYIKTAYKYGLCKELVLNDPNFEDKLLESIEEETKRLTDLLNEEKEKRRQEEQAAKLRKIRKDSLQRINDSLQNLKSIAFKKKFDLAEAKFKSDLQNELNDFNPIIKNAEFKTNSLRIFFDCIKIQGFLRNVKVRFKNGLGEIIMKNDDGFCGFRQDNEWTPTPSLDKSLRKALTTNKNIISLIDEISFEIIGVSALKEFDKKRPNKSINYPPLGKNHILKKPIIIKAKIEGN